MTTKAMQKPRMDTRTLAITSLMIALTVVMSVTPLGMIPTPFASITIAHLPILITVLVFGFFPGLTVAFAFGCISLIRALIAPASIIDPFFVNPLISILPRLLIPVTTYFVYKGMAKLLGHSVKSETLSVGLSVALGNLTNTFGVYTMLYLVYAREIFEKTGTPALTMIITAVSATTLIKCAGIVILSVPLVIGLKKALKYI